MQRVLLALLYFCSFFAVAGDTVLKLYRPFGESIEQIEPKAKTSSAGQCVGQSQLSIREDAWRCLAEGIVYDPCFVKMSGNQQEVLCPQSPWVSDSVLLVLNTSLSGEHHQRLDMSRSFPWAIELVNGEHCLAVEVNKLYDGMPIRYQCSGSNVLIGYLQRCKPEWSMLEKTSRGVETMRIQRAWF